MYFDLYLPFPLPYDVEDGSSKKNKKGKGKASAPNTTSNNRKTDCWDGLESGQKDGFARRVALTGHLGYSVVGCTITPGEPSNQVYPCPFAQSLPFPNLDPRSSSHHAGPSSSSSSSGSPPMVQVSRYHMRLDDNRVHPLTSQNTNSLRAYDLLSVAPTSEKAFQLACTDMANPGPNQVSIITLPLHERPFTFRFNRKQMRQAQRNGVVFELLYSPALFPPTSLPPDVAKRYRQNFLSNAREVVRITGGKGVIFSSGPGGGENGLRGALDIVNLGTMIGMPANLAKEAVEKAPRLVLLRAQARRTFKAVMSMPRIVPAPGGAVANAEDSNGVVASSPAKRAAEGDGQIAVETKSAKKVKT
ncbi:hypothetical protein CI109_100286 [Kwoniella shandongensis]|uniref:Uncharacterized protein n=1 Tax=Kwoniella shandongensis TaxID=1734106 RepID=A0A5M6C9R1_9TREE|nr:uncharacterized protein CI109_001869 [Kwoniella shandongensis]KAA5529929.1 hypothetical protein CI109_001869 [Kwoniella shandongensis]